MNKTILIATHNPNKVLEFKRILPKIKFISLADINDNEDFIETATTFEANSFLKADYYFQKHGYPTISDDSGLEVEVLNQAPGIYSKRYSGGDDHANNLKLLDEMKNQTNRKAQFRCVLTFIETDDEITQFEGVMSGEIALKLAGDSGFGYDPIFLIPSLNKTVAELGDEYKDINSHRAKALLLLKEHIDENTSYKWYSWR